MFLVSFAFSTLGVPDQIHDSCDILLCAVGASEALLRFIQPFESDRTDALSEFIYFDRNCAMFTQITDTN